MPTQLTPKGIQPRSHGSYSMGGIRFSGVSIAKGRHHQNTFKVTPKHTTLNNGVRFNVETVPEPLPEHLTKPRISRQDELKAIRQRLLTAPNKKQDRTKAASAHVEAASKHDPNLIYQGGNGFMVAVVTAFAEALKPCSQSASQS